MKTTAHELAKQLLEGPNLPVVICTDRYGSGDREPIHGVIETINPADWWDMTNPTGHGATQAIEIR